MNTKEDSYSSSSSNDSFKSDFLNDEENEIFTLYTYDKQSASDFYFAPKCMRCMNCLNSRDETLHTNHDTGRVEYGHW